MQKHIKGELLKIQHRDGTDIVLLLHRRINKLPTVQIYMRNGIWEKFVVERRKGKGSSPTVAGWGGSSERSGG
jgi:formylmethanofuran dehydrogenase subunit D